MSEVLAAARINTDGPFPTPPPYGLTAVAEEAPDDDHWRAGSFITPYPIGLPEGQGACAEGTLREKAEPGAPASWDEPFPAFTAYLGDICTASGIGDWNAWKARANAALAARISWALEVQLAEARFVTAPHLGDGNGNGGTPLGGGPVAPAVGIAHLEGAIADTGVEGVLHLTPEVVSYLGASFFRESGGVLRTASGTPVIVGRGYSDGISNFVTSDYEAPDPGESWAWATGPVLYRQDRLITNLPDTIAEALDRDDNTVIYRAEVDLWVGWDRVLQQAVLIDWSPS